MSIKNLIGNKKFYKSVFALMIPIMIQNGITNFVNMLDNVMIGAVGAAEMTGVSITNQLIFVFNLCVFGAVSGAGIFAAQYFGKKDYEGVHHTLRFKIIFAAIISFLGIALFAFFGEGLLGLYMKGETGLIDSAATLLNAKQYLKIMLIGLLPFSLVQAYSSTLREGGHPKLPMVAGLVAIFVNLAFNYILIFGKLGFSPLGVKGAAIATVMSRFVELFVVVLFSHKNTKKYPFMKGALKSLYIPRKMVSKIFIKSLPLIINETLWASGIAVVNQCYSVHGLDAMAALNISQTFWNVFSIAFIAVGSAVAVIIGQLLGANKLDEAKSESGKLIFFSFIITVAVAIIYIPLAEIIPFIYNTEPQIRSLATVLMQITAVIMPFEAMAHATYFTMRSGGKMLHTFVFDCGFTWGINVLGAFIISRYTSASLITLFAIIQSVSVLKCLIGILMVKSGFWVKNIISE